MPDNLIAEGITKQEIFSYPYVVHKDLAGQLGVDIPTYAKEFDDSLRQLSEMMEALAKKEAEKEGKFIENFINQNFKGQDNEFANELMMIFNSARNNKLSQLMDAIQKYRMNMYDCAKSIKENAELFEQEWAQAYNKTFVDAVKKLNLQGKDPLDMTVEEIVDLIEQNILNTYESTTEAPYGRFVNRVMNNIRKMASDKFGSDYTKLLRNLDENPYVAATRVRHSGTKKDSSTVSIIQGYVFGVINGLSAEVFLEEKGTGTSTARITQTLKTTTGKGAGAQVAIQTDVLEVLSMDFEIIPPDWSDTVEKTAQTADEMYKWLDTLNIEDTFVIHTSVKDQSTNRNYAAGNMSIDVRKDASLDARLQPLREICEKVSVGKKDIEELIFAIVNAGENMIAQGLHKEGKLVQGLVSVCAAYMFEDYVDTFSQLDSETTNNALHVYFINGQYYTLSDILLMARSTLKNQNSQRYVQISLRPTKKNEFAKENLVGLEGRARWEKVRENTLANGKMNVKLNTRMLVNTVYKNM